MNINPLMAKDFYKVGHKIQYPKGTEGVYSGWTPRNSSHALVSKHFDERVIFFGMQAFIIEHLIGTWDKNFFHLDKSYVIKEYKTMLDNALGVDSVDISHIEDLHDLGYLPIEVMALPEGSRVNIQVPMFTVENTKPEFFWLTNFLETWLSSEIWKPCTVATIAYEYRRTLEHWAEVTGGSKEMIDIQGHDFSCRGMSTMHDAAWSGMGHLLSFIGTDTISAIDYANKYYGGAVGVSVPATEHSVQCMHFDKNSVDESAYVQSMLDVYPTGIVSIVADGFDFWKMITETIPKFKDAIMSRQPDAMGFNKVVLRPDTGDPVLILTGYKVFDDYAERLALHNLNGATSDGWTCSHGEVYRLIDGYVTVRDGYWVEVSEHEVKGSVECLWDVFGGTINEKGFKTLDQHVGLIYGDSITLERAEQIMQRLHDKGFASDNVVLGIGSFTYQYITRDTFGFAMKATWGMIDGKPRMIKKEPKTDMLKKSATGRMVVTRQDDGSGYVLHDGFEDIEDHEAAMVDSAMVPVFRDGEAMNALSFNEVKANLERDK